jgi:hypothetical protein
MLRTRRLTTLLALSWSVVLLTVAGAAVAGAQTIAPAATGNEATTPMGVMRLPHRTIVHPDGTVEKIATPEALAKLTGRKAGGATAAGTASARAVYGCGYACDGMDPNSYVFQGSTCNDAETFYSVSQGGATAELRFSSRCQTAWSRTCCYVRAGGFGYTGSGVQRPPVYNLNGVYSGSKVWTAMLYDGSPNTFRACFDLILAGSGHDWVCTLRY